MLESSPSRDELEALQPGKYGSLEIHMAGSKSVEFPVDIEDQELFDMARDDVAESIVVLVGLSPRLLMSVSGTGKSSGCPRNLTQRQSCSTAIGHSEFVVPLCNLLSV